MTEGARSTDFKRIKCEFLDFSENDDFFIRIATLDNLNVVSALRMLIGGLPVAF